ncbi:hypothetical protein APHAL10511_006822 [Amanita phalloides]|nr:hypothetical protein APHAL10511_006822 [Amanita phalloides]
MMLVHKHTVLPLSPSLAHAHRRNPSAPPAVIVQPTRTPGLLSLSKPPRPSPPQQRLLHAQQRHQKAISRPRLASPATAAPGKPTPALAQLADSAFSDFKLQSSAVASSTQSPQPRGRAHAKQPREKPIANSRILTRSSSNNSLRGRPSRQPSPPSLPQAKTSQAEGPFARLSHSANLFDPFLDDASSHNPPPTLSHKPSGKLARRRQPQTGSVAGQLPSSPSPAASKAIPVPPLTTRTLALNISRSDPALSHMPRGQPRRRSSTAGPLAFDVFPICDDMTDAGDLSDHKPSPPVTPTRPKAQKIFRDGPRTAPAMGTFPSLPKPPSSAPQQKTREGGRKHKRSPSEGVFNMSSDEDSSTGWNPSVAALFQLTTGVQKAPTRAYTSPHKLPAPVTPKFARDFPPAAVQAKERQYEKEAAEKVAGYFASSSFQNSPSPEELPDPLFI